MHTNPQVLEEAVGELGVRCFSSKGGELILDFDATDDPLHRRQVGRFFHGYHGDYCDLPLNGICWSVPLWALLRSSNKDASTVIVEAIRRQFIKVKMVARGDSGFTREEMRGEGQRGVFLPSGHGTQPPLATTGGRVFCTRSGPAKD